MSLSPATLLMIWPVRYGIMDWPTAAMSSATNAVSIQEMSGMASFSSLDTLADVLVFFFFFFLGSGWNHARRFRLGPTPSARDRTRSPTVPE